MNTSEPKAPRPKRKSSGVVVPNQPRWHQRLAAWFVVALVRTIGATVRFHLDDRAGLLNDPPGPAIYCLWHNRLALCTVVHQRYVKSRKPAAKMAALVSASKDGAFLSAVLRAFKVEAVRGSSSRRGPQALLELTNSAQNGYDITITPDGPRGPCYVLQEGIMSLAQLTGLPIVPTTFNLSWKIQVNSWDRFQIPLPFSRCDVIVEKLVHIPREASDSERETLRRNLEQTLRAISKD